METNQPAKQNVVRGVSGRSEEPFNPYTRLWMRPFTVGSRSARCGLPKARAAGRPSRRVEDPGAGAGCGGGRGRERGRGHAPGPVPPGCSLRTGRC